MEIRNIDEFYAFLKNQTQRKEYDHIFRGVRNSTFELIPSIGRIKTQEDKQFEVDDEKSLFENFKKDAYPFIKDCNDDELELLAFAQHHGLPTRLLDWTRNPLIATYFAVENIFTEEDKKQTECSCIYIYKFDKPVKPGKTFDPFKIRDVQRYVPKYLDKRIITQSALFTVHNDPYTAWKPKDLDIVLIHESIRKKIKQVLFRLGVNSSVVYPDIDGIAKHIKWMRSNEH